jgi:anti-sigma regulatory factor (Ser/Thr protein kinase)
VQTFLRQIPDTCGIILDRMVTGAVLLAMENSFTHGHQLQEYLPISLKLFAGNNGCVVRICDSGAGFDYPEMYRRVRDGERILKTRGGMGTAIFLFRGFEISYEGKGNIFNLQINRGYNPERSLHLLSGE